MRDNVLILWRCTLKYLGAKHEASIISFDIAWKKKKEAAANMGTLLIESRGRDMKALCVIPSLLLKILRDDNVKETILPISLSCLPDSWTRIKATPISQAPALEPLVEFAYSLSY